MTRSLIFWDLQKIHLLTPLLNLTLIFKFPWLFTSSKSHLQNFRPERFFIGCLDLKH